MTALLDALLEINLAAAGAILLVLLIRKPARNLFGPHAAYMLWAVIPIAMLATFIPSRAIEMITLDISIYEAALQSAATATAGFDFLPAILIALWIIGAIAMAIALFRRQAAFMRDADLGLAGPAIVGFSQPRIVTPDDFSRRFSDAERKLILTHEQVHLDRNDARINALVALARCVFWFNPLVHAGAKAMRIDQELSCDAEVIDRRPRVRRAYAETLLKTQLASRPLPVGCYWPAEAKHPLADRIDMLTRKPHSMRRRAAATGIVLVMTASAGFAAWAAQPERTIITEAPDILVPFQPLPQDMKDPLVRIQQQLDRSPRPSADFSQPDYPADSITAREEGDVIVELCVASSGVVEDVKLVRSSGHQRLDQATVAGMDKSRFEPAMRDGRPVRLCGYNLTIGWRLDNAQAPPGNP